MTWLGDYRYGETISFLFTTRRFSTGAPHALSGGQLSCYKDGSTTQDSGAITLSASFDSITGLNHVSIDTDDTGADASTFYTDSGTVYDVVINTGTVDSVSVVGEVVGRFRLGFRPYVDAVWEALDTGLADTGTMGRLRQGVNVKKVVGDTGAAANVLQAFLDTGVATANMHKVAGDTGAAANVLQRFLDTGGLGLVDTGDVNNAVWEGAATDHGSGGTFGDNLDTTVSSRATPAQVADAVWVENLGDHSDTGKAGGYVVHNARLTTNAVWDEEDTGHSDTGTFGRLRQGVNVKKVIGDTGVAANLAQALLDTGVVTANAHKIAADTGAAANLKQAILDTGVIIADAEKIAGDTGAADALSRMYRDTGTGSLQAAVFADTLLDRNMATGTDSEAATNRTPRGALSVLRNRVEFDTGTVSVYKEDDSTERWTGTTESDTGSDGVKTIDPASS